ncbi:uncharacterized protein [Primulina huaijiensis]|uniref:uncharacterized protein n=1 Tax=Primulina huaijiensis TaxID=1492673 RepID=UPI003CC75E35
MEIPVPKNLKKLWELWELRSFLILSLSLQAVLILISPLRKRTKNDFVFVILWSAYLLADWAANFAVGIISNSQGNMNCSNKKGDFDSDLLAFWAPFLLVHLGGPDTISAFSLEDNELWLRHLAGLVFQSMAVVYVFLQSLPQNRVWMPTVFIFIDGLIKYAERTTSLYRASFNRFKESMLKAPDPGANYAQLMDEYRSMKDANLPTRIEMIREPERGKKSVDRVKKGKLNDTEVVLYAYRFFETFKGLIVDLIFSSRERNQSREFFLERNAEDAFRVIEVELSFIYESLFSKVVVVYSSYGYLFRFFSFALVVTSLGLFYCVDKTDFTDSRDVALSYTLLIGAIALDVIAFIKLVTSDWLTVTIKKLPDVDLKDPTKYGPGGGKSSDGYFRRYLQLLRRFFHPLIRHWSESVSCYNLIFYCLNPRPLLKEKIINLFNLTKFLDSRKYRKHGRFTEELRQHIFDELHMKSKMADDLYTAKEISAAKGDWTLRVESCTEFLHHILDVDYDQSILVWHIATELCYNDEAKSSSGKAGEKASFGKDGEKASSGEDGENYKKFSKLLSDYMLYLLIMQPQMMSEVAGIGQIRFRDTCAEAKNFFTSRSVYRKKKETIGAGFLKKVCGAIVILIAGLVALFILPLTFIISLVMNGCDLKEACRKITTQASKCFSDCKRHFSFWKVGNNQTSRNEMVVGDSSQAPRNENVVVGDSSQASKNGKGRRVDVNDENQRIACDAILGVYTEVKPVAIKGDRSKSVLFDGCILAKELKAWEEKNPGRSKWLIMSKVWVEMMSYAAINCSANTHAQQLSKGGELITMVWFLMIHFGLGDQFQINEGNDRAKLIVGK